MENKNLAKKLLRDSADRLHSVREASPSFDLTRSFLDITSTIDEAYVLAHDDAYIFAEHVFPDSSGWSDTGYLKLQWFHRQLLDALLSPVQNILVMMPRGVGKSSSVAAYIAWIIGNNPNIRILFCSNSEDQATGVSDQIGEVIESERYKKVFGDIRGTKDWSKQSKRVQRSTTAREPTLSARGVGSAVMLGSHYDLVVLDDVVDLDSALSAAERDHTYKWYGSTIRGLLDPQGKLVVIGTAWAKGDLYYHLLQDWAPLVASEEAIIIRLESPPEQPLWPERFSSRYLERWQASNPIEFQYQMLNRYEDSIANYLRREWLKIIEESDIPPSLDIYLGVDLSTRTKTTAKRDPDYFCIAVIGQDRRTKQLYVLDIVREQADLQRQTLLLDRVAARYASNLQQIRIESNAAQHLVIQHFQEHLVTDLSRHIIYSESTESKVVRLTRKLKEGDQYIPVAGLFSSGRVLLAGYEDRGTVFPKESLQTFIDEWVTFPNGAHDDTLDAVQKALEPFAMGQRPIAEFVNLAPQAQPHKMKEDALEGDSTEPWEDAHKWGIIVTTGGTRQPNPQTVLGTISHTRRRLFG